MRIIPRVLTTFLIIAMGFVSFERHAIILAEQTKEQEKAKVKFRWAFAAIKETADGLRLQAITRDTALNTGDKIKFFLKIRSKCFVYLIYRSSQNEFEVLFPPRFQPMNGKYDILQRHYIPSGDRWFEFDEQVGQEKFYLLASADRLDELEAILNQYESAERTNRPVIAQKIQSEIRKLRKQHLALKSNAERPVSIIGALRGTQKILKDKSCDVANIAIEISADAFYSRTFTIDHQ